MLSTQDITTSGGPEDQLIWKLDKLYPKQTSKQYERSQLFRISQQPAETMVDYDNRMLKKSIVCEFNGTTSDEMLLVC